MEQSFHSDRRQKTYYGLGYVMPYYPLADLLYSNSMSIGRTKMPSRRKHKKACKKAVNLKPRPAAEWEETWEGKKAGEKVVKRAIRESRHLPSPSPRSPTEMPTPTDEEEEWWGEWNWWGKSK